MFGVIFPGLHLFFGRLFLVTVALLDFADQLFAFPFDDRQIVIGQLASFLFHFAFQLLPVTVGLIFIHSLSVNLW